MLISVLSESTHLCICGCTLNLPFLTDILSLTYWNNRELNKQFFCDIRNFKLFSRLTEWFGIDGVVLQWVRSYLTGRSQLVKVNGVPSTPHDRDWTKTSTNRAPIFCDFLPISKVA